MPYLCNNGIGLSLTLLFLVYWQPYQFMLTWLSKYRYYSCPCARATNRPGMAGTVPELTSGVPCPGMGHVSVSASFTTGN